MKGFKKVPRPKQALLALTVTALAGGGVLNLASAQEIGDPVWIAAAVAGLVPLAFSTVRDALKREPGVDIIALLAIAGALALGEYLAGAVLAVMVASGWALEDYAGARASRELRGLLERAPRVVQRYEMDGLAAAPLETVLAGDLLLVRPGEVLPVDGVVAGGGAVLDESALTGEAQPVEREEGDQVSSGTVNAGGPFDLRATASAEQSTYAGIVRLVKRAQESKAPFVRLANRYALAFVPLTLTIAAAAWAVSGETVRALAVLVVATPCPLILATPVAIVSGISRAAKRGIIMKGGGVLETLARARTLLFDKTGTLTAGRPAVTQVEAPAGIDSLELLRLAASLDQVSHHVLASAIVRAARSSRLNLPFPKDVAEEPGKGIRGRVNGTLVAVGRADWVTEERPLPRWAHKLRRRTAFEGMANVFVAVDGRLTGAFILEDPVRPDTPRTIRSLRRAGIRKMVMVTGDHVDVAETVGAAIGVDHVLAERSPEEKVEAVLMERRHGLTIMVGDGINDAPALAAADVGVAMGARGASASSEAADVVLVVDRLDRLAEALRISQRARGIAVQSVVVGMGLSFAAMVLAAAGYLAPVAGAFLQEGIDVLVILNALRALGGYTAVGSQGGPAAVLSQRFQSEHAELLPVVNHIRTVADSLGHIPSDEAQSDLREVYRFLTEEVIPHEMEEEETFYPLVASILGSDDATETMIRAHAEIKHLIRVFKVALEDFGAGSPSPEDLAELRRILYGLYAILRLHFAQEAEAYHSLVDTEPARGSAVVA